MRSRRPKYYSTQKVFFRLTTDERNAMLDTILTDIRLQLSDFKLSGAKFGDIANTIGLPKQRISEVFNARYIGEETLKKLVAHGYVDPSRLLSLDLTDDQKAALFDLLLPI